MNTKDHPLDYRAIAEACNYIGNGPVTTEMITGKIRILKEAVEIWQRAALGEGKRAEELADELDCQEKATAFISGHYEKAKRAIAAMAKLLDAVPHFHSSYNPEDRMDIKDGQDQHGHCASDCPACQWAKLKSAAAQT